MTHSTRTPFFPANLSDYAPWVATHGLTAPYGECQCGCGQPAPIATKTQTRFGKIKGHPAKRIQNHRGVWVAPPSLESVAPEKHKLIALSQGKAALVDAADYEWISAFRWYARRDHDTWYAYRRVTLPSGKIRAILLHRAILDAGEGVEVDHKDGDGLNNTRDNLRLATDTQNAYNRAAQRNNTSGYKGVTQKRNKRKWAAQIVVDGEQMRLGYFDSPEDAARAYDAAARIHHGEFAYQNFGQEGAGRTIRIREAV